MNVLDISVDGTNGRLLGGRLEPGGEVIGTSTGGSVSVGGQCDGISDCGLEGGGLSGAATAVGYGTLGDT